jgi:MinD superfamily P-loop ATPase
MEVGPAVSVGIEVYIDPDLCNSSRSCRTSQKCVDLCSMGVFVKVKGNGVFSEKSNLCIMCLMCQDFCPEHAISTRWTHRA